MNTATPHDAEGYGATRPPTPPAGQSGCPLSSPPPSPRSGRCSGTGSPGPSSTTARRCGWSGYFHEYLVTIDGHRSNAVCDNSYADLHPGIAVSVKFFSARALGAMEPFAVIREGNRSNHRFPDLGQQLAWSLCWEHTTVLAEEARGECGHDVVPVSGEDAGAARRQPSLRYWTPEAAQLPWVIHAYPP